MVHAYSLSFRVANALQKLLPSGVGGEHNGWLADCGKYCSAGQRPPQDPKVGYVRIGVAWSLLIGGSGTLQSGQKAA